MPLPIAHGFLGAAIVAVIHPKIKKVISVPLFIGAFLANAPDFDFLFVILTKNKSWHRGFSHSILFSIIVFITIAAFLGKDRIRTAAAYGSAYFSHVVLDFIATKFGGGLELFWFFSSERFALRWRGLSEVPSKLSNFEILQAVGLELILFGTLFAALFLMRKYIFRQAAEI